MRDKAATLQEWVPQECPQCAPCTVITQCHPDGALPHGKGEEGDALGVWRAARSLDFLRWAGLDPATLVVAAAGYCSSASGLGACLGWGLHNSPSQGGMWDGEAAPSPVGQDGSWLHGEEEEEEEEMGSGQQPGIMPGSTVFPGWESSHCCPDSAHRDEPDFKSGGADVGLLLCKAWRAACSTKAGRDLMVHQ